LNRERDALSIFADGHDPSIDTLYVIDTSLSWKTATSTRHRPDAEPRGEVSPFLPRGFVGQPVQLDTSGTPGALFGIVATVDGQGNQVVYFNDDDTNSVMMMTQ
jgi:hypothetical protein